MKFTESFAPLLAAAAASQSALEPATQQAGRIASLFWWMVVGSAIVVAGVIALTIYAIRAHGGPDRVRQADMLVVAGAVTPAVLLAGLLIYGLGMLPGSISRAPEASLRVSVYAEQWWWRARYHSNDVPVFEVANEIRLPLGEPVEFILQSNNVIHSFWIPSMGGKMDVIPGRTNRLTLLPNKAGRFRGVCAEYCGAGHANMAFDVVVSEKSEFVRWMAHQAAPAAELQP